MDTVNLHPNGQPRHLWVIGMARQWLQPAAESGLAENPAMTTWGTYGVAARTIEVEMRSRRTAEEIVWHWGANHQSVLRRSDLLSIEVRQLRGKEANAKLQKQTNKVKQQYQNRKRKQRGGASGAGLRPLLVLRVHVLGETRPGCRTAGDGPVGTCASLPTALT